MALLFRARNWLSSGEDDMEPGRGGHDLAVYRDQLSEIDSDLTRGLLTEAQAEEARLEVERRLLAADREQTSLAKEAPKTPAFSPGLRRRSLMALMVLVPVVAFALYLYLGSPGLPGQPFAERGAPDHEAGVPDVTAGDIAAMVERLAAKLEQEPEDLEGWGMLAQSYLVLERPLEARAALRKGMEHFPHDPDLILTLARLEVVLAQEAQAQGTSDPTEAQGTSGTEGQTKDQGTATPGVLSGEAVPRIPPEAAYLYGRLLAVAPEHGEALWTVGLAEAQAGNLEKAAALWRRLLVLMPEDSEGRAALEEYLGILERGQGASAQ